MKMLKAILMGEYDGRFTICYSDLVMNRIVFQ